MSHVSSKIRKLIQALHEKLGSGTRAERRTASDMLDALLLKHKLTWRDLPEILAPSVAPNDSEAAAPEPAAPEEAPSEPVDDVLGLIMGLFRKHVTMPEDEILGPCLWAAHSWVFNRFIQTPRLLLQSSDPGSGKGEVLKLLSLLCRDADLGDDKRPAMSGAWSPASIFTTLGTTPGRTILMDEADNSEIYKPGVLRQVVNDGNQPNGCVKRKNKDGMVITYPTFAPLAVAALVKPDDPRRLPPTLLERSLIYTMHYTSRHDTATPRPRLDPDDPDTADACRRVCRGLRHWAKTCVLSKQPDMPRLRFDREEDNWLPLVSIADSLGYGEAARGAAVAMSTRPVDDPGVNLLRDIRDVFREYKVGGMEPQDLVDALNEMDLGRLPRKLTTHQLARMLRQFRSTKIDKNTGRPERIKPGSVRLPKARNTFWGYDARWFTDAWDKHCPEAKKTKKKKKNLSR